MVEPDRLAGKQNIVPTQKWKVVVAKLGTSSATLHEGEVEATNWMSALRATRQAMSERPSLPPGASCTVDATGVATILDPSSRRKFVLSPQLDAAPRAVSGTQQPAQPQAAPPAPVRPVAAAPAQPAASPAPPRQVANAQRGPAPAPSKPKRFATVAMIPDAQATAHSRAQAVAVPTESNARPHSPSMERRAVAQAPEAAHEHASGRAPQELQPAPPAPVAAEKPKKRFETVAFVNRPGPSAANDASKPELAVKTPPAPQPRSDASKPIARPPLALEQLFERNEEPSPNNPLLYRECAYLLPKGATITEAEAAVRWKLAEIRQALERAPRGKLINLAVFDHRWSGAPERPPVIVLQWRDWRDEIAVDYPAAARSSSAPPASVGPHDDRLADVFEALEDLPRLRSAAEGLDFIVKLLERMIPAEATSACLYDINTDELRFVAVSGTSAAAMQGAAVPRAAGLFAQAMRSEHNATVIQDVLIEPTFDPKADARPDLEPQNALLRPVVHEHQLLGMLQLINRAGASGFSAQDVSVVNYIAERLADFLFTVRTRPRGSA